MTGSPVGALWAFLIFYVICLVITWAYYTRRGGLLHDVERNGQAGIAASSPNPAQ
ncbi:Nitrate/nitrite transporter NarU [compost metagenome]